MQLAYLDAGSSVVTHCVKAERLRLPGRATEVFGEDSRALPWVGAWTKIWEGDLGAGDSESGGEEGTRAEC